MEATAFGSWIIPLFNHQLVGKRKRINRQKQKAMQVMALLLIFGTRPNAVAANRSTNYPPRAPSGLNGSWTEMPGTSCDGAKIKDFRNTTLELAKANCTKNSVCGCITLERLSGRRALYTGVAVVPRSHHYVSYISDASQALATWIISTVNRALL